MSPLRGGDIAARGRDHPAGRGRRRAAHARAARPEREGVHRSRGAQREALGLCASHRGSIDLILSDIIMPEVGGRALAEGFAASRPRTRVLFMSGYTDDDVLRRALIDQRTAFLQKPFTPITLSKRVREVLDAGRE